MVSRRLPPGRRASKRGKLKPATVQLHDGQREDLIGIAIEDDCTFAQVVRDAVDMYLEHRREAAAATSEAVSAGSPA